MLTKFRRFVELVRALDEDYRADLADAESIVIASIPGIGVWPMPEFTTTRGRRPNTECANAIRQLPRRVAR